MTNKIESTSTQTLAADGSVAFSIPFVNSAALVTIFATGDLGGGTLKAEISPDGTTWVDADAGTLTEAGIIPISGALCREVRATLTGATSPSVNIVVLY
jgi:hypothetical protein